MKKYKKYIIFISIFLIVILTIFIVITYIYSSQEKNFKVNIQQAKEVHIESGNTGEFILLSKEDIEKLVNKLEEISFKPALFPERRVGWLYEISYKIGENDWWSMVFGGGYIKISHNGDTKSYQNNRELEEYVGNMYKELGGK